MKNLGKYEDQAVYQDGSKWIFQKLNFVGDFCYTRVHFPYLQLNIIGVKVCSTISFSGDQLWVETDSSCF